jgi:hypothetical protein
LQKRIRQNVANQTAQFISVVNLQKVPSIFEKRGKVGPFLLQM